MQCRTQDLYTLSRMPAPPHTTLQGMRTHEFLQRMVIGGGRLAVPQDDNVCPLALRRIMSACWADAPSERPSCEEIIGEGGGPR